MMVRKCKEIIKLVSLALYIFFRWRFDMRQNFVVSDLGSLEICLLLSGGIERKKRRENMIHTQWTRSFGA